MELYLNIVNKKKCCVSESWFCGHSYFHFSFFHDLAEKVYVCLSQIHVSKHISRVGQIKQFEVLKLYIFCKMFIDVT